jgi:hypothetical protein
VPIRESRPGALEELTGKVRYLQGAGFRSELSQVLAAEGLHQLEDGFLRERDPYGKPWPRFSPHYRRRRGDMARAKLLRRTGRMYNSRAAEPTSHGFRLSITAAYALAHQKGALIKDRHGHGRPIILPRRQMVPEKETGGLGPIWLAAFNKAADDLMRRRMGRAA